MATNLVPITSTNLSNLEETIAAGNTGSAVAISAGSGEYIDELEVQIKVTFDSAPTANGDTVDLYASSSSDSGTTMDQDNGSKDVGQNHVGAICDDKDAATNTYIKTLYVHPGRYCELLIANTTDASVTVNSVYYDGIKIVNS